MKKFNYLLTILFVAAGILSCKKTDDFNSKIEQKLSRNTAQNFSINNSSSAIESPQNALILDPNLIVYIGGTYFDGQYNQACYWNDGVLNPVQSESTDSYGLDIAVEGADVYIAGYINDIPCFWKNGKRTNLNTNGWYGYASKILHSNGSKYILGAIQPDLESYYIPVLWIVDQNMQIQEYKLTNNPDPQTSANSLKFIGNDLYIAGTNKNLPCYWKLSNSALESFVIGSSKGKLYSVDSYNGDLHLFGQDNFSVYGYWVNGNFFILNLSSPLPYPKYEVHTTKINADGRFHSIGYSRANNSPERYASFWFDFGVPAIHLSNKPSFAADIEMNDFTLDVYIVGNVLDEACIWKNNFMFSLNTPKSRARGLVLVHK